MNARVQPPAITAPTRTPIPAPTRTPILPLVKQHGGIAMAHSRDVAAYFAKEHKAVLRAIRDAKCSPDFRGRHFAPFYIKGLDGEEITDYCLMTKSGFAFVVLAFTGDKAAPFREDYINAFDRMEAELLAQAAPVDPMAFLSIPSNVMQVLGQIAQRAVELEGQLAVTGQQLAIAHHTIEEQSVTVVAHDRLTNAHGGTCVTDTAKRLGVGPKALFAYMRNPEAKVRWLIQRTPHAEDVVHQDRLNAGHMANPVETVTVYPRDEAPREKLVTRTYVTPLGLGYLARLIVAGKDPLLPVPVDLLHVLKISRGNHLFD